MNYISSYEIITDKDITVEVFKSKGVYIAFARFTKIEDSLVGVSRSQTRKKLAVKVAIEHLKNNGGKV